MRIKWRDFSKGLFLGGSREATPQGFARRLTGFASSAAGDYLRLRYRHEGRLTVGSFVAHSMVRFEDQLYAAVGRGFYRGAPGVAGGSPTTAAILVADASAFFVGCQSPDYQRMTFVAGRPVAGKGLQGASNYLFGAGGGAVFKVRKSGTLSRWGIPSPLTALTVRQADLVAGQNYFRPPLFANNLVEWSSQTVDATLTNVVDNYVLPGDPPQVGKALNIAVASDTLGKILGIFTPTANFSQFGAGYPSSNQDLIVLDVKCINIANLDSIEIKFYNDPSGANQSAMSFTIVADDAIVRENTSGANGIGDITEIAQDEEGFINNPPDAASGTSRDIVERMSVLKLSGADGVWTRLKIPKSAFAYTLATDFGSTQPWSRLTAMEVLVTTNKNTFNGGGVTVRISDDGGLFGGVGMFGHYKYCETLRDSVTRQRSNPGPITEIDVVARQGAQIDVDVPPLTDTSRNTQGTISGLPLSSTGAPLVREIWRTFGNGSVFFKHSELVSSAGTGGTQHSTIIDKVADWRGMNDLDPPSPLQVQLLVGTYAQYGVLQKEVLTFDNIAPDHGFSDCFGLAYGRMFWCRDQTPERKDMYSTTLNPSNFPGIGRVYYSPPGRIESVAGFIDVTQGSADPTQKGVIWNGIYVFTQKRCFEIVGTDEPFGAREILGVPGTIWPHTVVPTPYGILYEALDGIRVFDGSGSQLLPFPAIEPFFRRDTNMVFGAGMSSRATNLNHFACFTNDEYRWCDGTTFLGFNLRTGAWRNIGAPIPEGLAVDAFGECYGGLQASASNTTRVITSLEFGSIGGDYTTSAASTSAIAYEFETPGAIVDGRDTFLVQRVYLDINLPSDQTADIVLVTGDGAPASGPSTSVLTTITGTGVRELRELNAACAYVSVPGVRISGAGVTGSVRIHGVEEDIHIPEVPGTGT